jgi:hypothetical protein
VLWIFTTLVFQVYYTSPGGDWAKVFQFWFILKKIFGAPFSYYEEK